MSGAAVSPRIRAACAADVPRIGEIARAAYLRYVARIGREPAPMTADFAAEIAAGRVVVIDAGGRLVGYLVAWPETDAYFIENIAVDPAEQGRGFGRQLMIHAEREARRQGLPAIRLYTTAAMSENLSLYGRMGFAETHRAIEQWFSRVFMRRVLGTTSGDR